MSSPIPSAMKGLVQKHDGYASEPSGFDLEAVDPWLELTSVPVPEPGDDQVLVRISRASVNPSDVMFIQGLYGQPRQKGRVAGFEAVGTVVSAGSKAQGLMGKRVAFTSMAGGTWAPYALANASLCIPLIDGVSDEDGAAMVVNPLTALAMLAIAREEGPKAFIMTAGASQLCKLIAAEAAKEGMRPISIVRRADQIDFLKQRGAEHVLNYTAEDFEEKLAALCKEEKPRILLDAVAGPVSSTIFETMGKGARWIIYGRLEAEPPVLREPGQMIFMSKRIEGFWLSKWLMQASEADRNALIMKAQQNYASGTWKTDITATLSLDEAMDQLPAKLAEPNGKVLLAP